ncbi:hypothetical protein HYH33_17615 [Clostridium botulinum]|nr:hypothetical protein [Clostridium botulinum]
MRLRKKVLCFLCSCLFLSTACVVNAKELTTEPNTANLENAITNIASDEDIFSSIENDLNEGDEIIQASDSYYRVDQYDSEAKPERITKEDYINESKPATIEIPTINRGYHPGDSISVPDRWNWIKLRMYCIKLSSPVHNNRYQFTAGYNWKHQPSVIAGKDVFGIANNGNIAFDSSTMRGQSTTHNTIHPYGVTTNYTPSSADVIESINGVAFKHQLTAGYGVSNYPSGSISVCGNPLREGVSAGIGVTYAHSQITGSSSISFSKSGPSVSVSPSLSFDSITSTAAIDFR